MSNEKPCSCIPAPSDTEILEYTIANSDVAFRHRLEDGTIDKNGVIQEIMKQRKETLLTEQHKHDIWYAETEKCWRTYVTDDSKPKHRRKIERKTKEALIDYLLAFYAEQPPTLTLKGIYEEWLSDKEKSGVKGSTMKKTRSSWNRFYKSSTIVSLPLADLDEDILRQWAISNIKEFTMTKHMFGDFSAILRQMLDYAVKKKYIESNEYEKVKIKRNQLYISERKSDGEMIFFEDEQIVFEEYLWDTYYKERHSTQLFIPLAINFDFYEGPRDCELAVLRWGDIDNGKMHIQRMVDSYSGEIVNQTKGGKPRTVPLHTEAIKILETIKKKRIEKGLPISPSDYIFCPNDSPIATYKAIEKYMPKYCREIGLTERNIHSCRRTWISTLIDANVNIHTVAEWAGHESIQTTLKCYVYNRKRENVRFAEYNDALSLKKAANH